ncbi:class I tRNA ligase family protein [endosymbiont GvMRE of Glomus versiforme]|uniref:class I tRNA ligase family protein n=1 Tax=endosymbiont GvMRE of Glomus versiforme TaxID=2039283 RepID=UPI000EB9C1CA|nr:class I tRNA ligase family protein [endosymbiont GvMRE of Glomus versiforme]RHZ36045.1 Isoleucine--tRNA ligase [endosymbiont GvMRE of Glomus versiforme]
MDPKKIKDTLFLPKTNFPLKNLNHQEIEDKIREKWEKYQVYQKLLEENKKGPSFILHSGPPYANGKLHIGHFLNFIIKDIIIRFQASQGNYTPFLLGWDAHGLPIEHKMLEIYKDKKIDLRPVCHQFALEQAQIQREQLKKLGLFTDFEKYYITSKKEYEAEQLRIFGEMVKKNLIYQGYRPIHWSCGHETALAEAEIEYYEKKDTSLYFKIKLADNFFGKENVSLLVWTTQPWTIPANQLVAVKKKASYALINYNDEYLLILESKISLLEKWNEKKIKVEKVFLGETLLGLTYFHPYRKDIKGYIVDGNDFIEEKEGTGIVHLAPAFGMEDFMAAKKEKLTIECPLEPNGLFNEKIAVPELIGKHYSEVNKYVITDLEKKNLIAKKAEISHSYPHDWRDKSPLIYRLTKQWFINIQTIKPDLLKNIEKVKWYPSWTKEKMKQAISSRGDWCISRQRKWGVPIPVLFNNDEPLLIPEIIDYIADIFEKNGSDCWFDGTILPPLQEKFPQLINKNTKLGTDIMDVWFDSGVSHWCVLKKQKK